MTSSKIEAFQKRKAAGKQIADAANDVVNDSIKELALLHREILQQAEKESIRDIMKTVRKVGSLHRNYKLPDAEVAKLMRLTIDGLGRKAAVMGSIQGSDFYDSSRRVAFSNEMLSKIDTFSTRAILSDDGFQAIVDKMESELMYTIGNMINGDKEWDWGLIEKEFKRSTSAALYAGYRETIAERAIGDPINTNTDSEVTTRRLPSSGACKFCIDVSDFAFNTAPYHAGCRCTEVPIFPTLTLDSLDV